MRISSSDTRSGYCSTAVKADEHTGWCNWPCGNIPENLLYGHAVCNALQLWFGNFEKCRRHKPSALLSCNFRYCKCSFEPLLCNRLRYERCRSRHCNSNCRRHKRRTCYDVPNQKRRRVNQSQSKKTFIQERTSHYDFENRCSCRCSGYGFLNFKCIHSDSHKRLRFTGGCRLIGWTQLWIHYILYSMCVQPDSRYIHKSELRRTSVWQMQKGV